MQTKKSGGKIFFILIPIFIVIASFLYDNIIMVTSRKKYRLDTELIIKDVLTNSYYEKEEMVKQFYEDKNLETEQLNVKYEDDVLYIYNIHTFPAFFGKVFGVNSYRAEVDVKAYKDGDKIIIEDMKEE